jgi:hypothetical protein
MTESFTKKRVLGSYAVHKIQGAGVLTALALLLACSLQAFTPTSVSGNAEDDTGQPLPALVKTTPNGNTTDADEKHFTCLS